VLALACFPVLAQADSSGTQYSDAPPTATGGKEPVPIDGGPSAKPSTTPSGGATAPQSSAGSNGSDNGEAAENASSEGSGVSGAGNDGGTGQQSSPEDQRQGASKSDKQPLQASPSQAKADSSGDGGSSPLLPIILAVVVLAGISVAALLMRQRHQRGNAPGSLSEKAS
jgi:cobalamin biosynthesis Mg chelatase CobN